MDHRPFDYRSIPIGYYDKVLHEGRGVRKLWHLSKFERVLDCLPRGGAQSLLDIGCFAGSFLSLVPENRFSRQLGIDILPEQIAYAQAHYGTAFREFRHIQDSAGIAALNETFDCVTLIEVIEHLTPEQVEGLLAAVAKKLEPGGRLIITTPNYMSAWPLIEFTVNHFSEVKYEEQHISKFSYPLVEKQIAKLYPRFLDEFTVDTKTTTHFLTPFLAALNFDGARALSRLVPHKHWRHPFGNLVLMVCVKK